MRACFSCSNTIYTKHRLHDSPTPPLRRSGLPLTSPLISTLGSSLCRFARRSARRSARSSARCSTRRPSCPPCNAARSSLLGGATERSNGAQAQAVGLAQAADAELAVPLVARPAVALARLRSLLLLLANEVMRFEALCDHRLDRPAVALAVNVGVELASSPALAATTPAALLAASAAGSTVATASIGRKASRRDLLASCSLAYFSAFLFSPPSRDSCFITQT